MIKTGEVARFFIDALIMKASRKLHRIQSSLLLHELSFVLLILITAGIGISWTFAWQSNSAELLRLTQMDTYSQNIRGKLYRQLKEVFDASYLEDDDAIDEYDAYTKRIRLYIDDHHLIADDEIEQRAVDEIAIAYEDFYQTTHWFLQQGQFGKIKEQTDLLDEQLEGRTFTAVEFAFSEFEIMLQNKRSLLEQQRRHWMSKILLLAPVPVLIGISLLLLSRRYVKRNVLQPLDVIMAGAKRISTGDLQYNIAEAGVEDLARLARAINRMADELVRQRDTLVEVKKQAALGELVPLVAHNIRNPLAGIRAAAQVTLGDDLDPAIEDALHDIIITVDRLEGWVTSLLMYLHPIQPHFTQENLLQVMDNSLSLMSLSLQEKNISLIKTGWEVEATNLALDINLMEQTLFNLLQNALEASTFGGTLRLYYEEQPDKVQLMIEDEGKGMTFDPVSEQVIDGESKQLSCGLGIPFALKVIKQHGGSLHYESRFAGYGGTRVIIYLPLLFNPEG